MTVLPPNSDGDAKYVFARVLCACVFCLRLLSGPRRARRLAPAPAGASRRALGALQRPAPPARAAVDARTRVAPHSPPCVVAQGTVLDGCVRPPCFESALKQITLCGKNSKSFDSCEKETVFWD